MPLWLGYPVVLVLAYLLGSISFSYLAVRLVRRQDLRTQGSGNLGALNASRQLGWVGFLLVLAADAGKGALAVGLSRHLTGTDLGALLGAWGALLGHNYSLYLGFSGGKGLACAVGILLALAPLTLLALLVIAGVLLLVTRSLHVAPAVAAAFFPLFAWWHGHSWEWPAVGALMAGVVIKRHLNDLRTWFTAAHRT